MGGELIKLYRYLNKAQDYANSHNVPHLKRVIDLSHKMLECIYLAEDLIRPVFDKPTDSAKILLKEIAILKKEVKKITDDWND